MNKCLNCDTPCGNKEDFCCEECEREYDEAEQEYGDGEEDYKTVGDNY